MNLKKIKSVSLEKAVIAFLCLAPPVAYVKDKYFPNLNEREIPVLGRGDMDGDGVLDVISRVHLVKKGFVGQKIQPFYKLAWYSGTNIRVDLNLPKGEPFLEELVTQEGRFYTTKYPDVKSDVLIPSPDTKDPSFEVRLHERIINKKTGFYDFKITDRYIGRGIVDVGTYSNVFPIIPKK
jgi:hypothetical protein